MDLMDREEKRILRAELFSSDKAKARFEGSWDRDDINVCWLWKGNIDTYGYGRFWTGKKTIKAHRAVYMYIIGACPSDKVSDHLCRNKRCVNPYHLEFVNNGENVSRGNTETSVMFISNYIRLRRAIKGV
jgi:hypothetical protein